MGILRPAEGSGKGVSEQGDSLGEQGGGRAVAGGMAAQGKPQLPTPRRPY